MKHNKSIPRRLSVDDANIDWDVANRLDIRLNGEIQKYVSEYNIDGGYIVRRATDENGNFKLNEAKDEVVSERVNGVVTVTWKAE